MSNRNDFENVGREIEGLGRERVVTELHNAYVAGQESVDVECLCGRTPVLTPCRAVSAVQEILYVHDNTPSSRADAALRAVSKVVRGARAGEAPHPDLDKLEAVLAKASKGPWKVETNRHTECDGTRWGWVKGTVGSLTWSHRDVVDAEAVVALWNAAPALLAELRQLRAQRASEACPERLATFAECARLCLDVAAEYEKIGHGRPQTAAEECADRIEAHRRVPREPRPNEASPIDRRLLPYSFTAHGETVHLASGGAVEALQRMLAAHAAEYERVKAIGRCPEPAVPDESNLAAAVNTFLLRAAFEEADLSDPRNSWLYELAIELRQAADARELRGESPVLDRDTDAWRLQQFHEVREALQADGTVPASDTFAGAVRSLLRERRRRWKGLAQDGSVGFDCEHDGRRALVTFATDGDVEILITKAAPASESTPKEGS